MCGRYLKDHETMWTNSLLNRRNEFFFALYRIVLDACSYLLPGRDLFYGADGGIEFCHDGVEGLGGVKSHACTCVEFYLTGSHDI